jgi:hypothetical protein
VAGGQRRPATVAKRHVLVQPEQDVLAVIFVVDPQAGDRAAEQD